MSKLSKTNRILAAIALAGVTASILAPQSAEAFRGGGGGGGRGFGGGGFHAGGGHSGGGHFGGGHFGGNHSFGHRDPGRHVADRTPNWTRHPGRVPPIRIKLPPRKWPPIWIPGRHRWPPVIVRVPPRFVPPVIVTRPRLPVVPVVPVVVAGGPIVRPVAAMPTPVARAACVTDGSFITIVFVPTVTAADITAFLNTYDVTMADGPNRDGIYRIRLSAKVLPQNDVLKIIEAMRAQTQIVASIEGA